MRTSAVHELIDCPECGNSFYARGLATHRKSRHGVHGETVSRPKRRPVATAAPVDADSRRERRIRMAMEDLECSREEAIAALGDLAR